MTAALVIEELAKGCASTAMCYTMHMATVPLIGALAKDGQLERWVQPIARCERPGSVAMSEPGQGNRLWHMDSYAVRENGNYVTDSYKSFATNSGYADYYVVPVRASAQHKPTDLSLFIIDGKDPNILSIGKWKCMGLRGNSSTPIHFNKCRVSDCDRLGDPTSGLAMLFAYSLPIYQVGLSSVYLCIAHAAYDAGVEQVKKRVHNDTKKALATVETIQWYISKMHAA